MKRTPLGRDAGKVREWLRQSRLRAPLRRKAAPTRATSQGGTSQGLGGRRTPLRRKAGRKRKALPQPVRAAAFARSAGNCVACEARRRATSSSGRDGQPEPIRRAAHPHHVLPVQKWPELELVLANIVGVCAQCHDDHERANRRIPMTALPAETVRMATALGPAAHDYLKRVYPNPSKEER